MNIRHVVYCAAIAFLAAVAFAAAPASAQSDYPNRPIRLITPAAQGGTTDFLARLFGARLGEVFKQQVLVDNRASASGVIAAELTANAQPDGYTLLLIYHQQTINVALNPKLPYDPVTSFTPITQLTSAAQLLVIPASAPPRNLAEFILWTKNYQGALNFGSAGIGSGGHLSGELYKLMTGMKAEHVPYKGSGPAMAALLAGEYQFNFAAMLASLPHVRSGRLRAIAVTSPKRIASLPDVPAMSESLPGYEVVGWYGIVGPANLPRPIVDRLHSELIKILNRPDVRERIHADGSEPVGSTPEEFRQFIRGDVAKWTRVVRESNIKAE